MIESWITAGFSSPRQWIAAVPKIISQIAWMALFACLVTAGNSQALADIPWHTQLKTAHAQAMQEGKLLLLHFYTDNCVYCDKLEAGAFKAPEVTAAIQKSYVAVKIHAGKNPAIASTFKVSRFPTDVIVTTQGQALAHSVSPQDPARYVAMLAQHSASSADGSMIATATAIAAPVIPHDGTSSQLSTPDRMAAAMP